MPPKSRAGKRGPGKKGGKPGPAAATGQPRARPRPHAAPTTPSQNAPPTAAGVESPLRDALPPPSTAAQKAERRRKRRVQLQEWRARQEKDARRARAARRLGKTTAGTSAASGHAKSIKWDETVYFLGDNDRTSDGLGEPAQPSGSGSMAGPPNP